jgi:hypothetical protein
MNIQTQIENCLEEAKAYAGTWAAEIVTNENNGLDQCCANEETAFYTEWINILEDFYQKAYLGVAYPGYRYITEQQALPLMARINARDFKKQTGITVSVDGAFNDDFNDDFDIS